MSKKIIQIDESKCVGCGLCANACQQGAIKVIDGKAKVIRDDYCDGLGNCLPVCPVNAISFSNRDVINTNPIPHKKQTGCPGSAIKTMNRETNNENDNVSLDTSFASINSQLKQWPVQIKLVPTNAPFYNNANLLVAADCTAFSYGDFHNKFIKNKITLIGCPKLDMVDYTEKLTEIIKNNDIKSLTIVKMEVPCCSGLEKAASNALKESGKFIPWQVVTISTDGRILEN